MNCTTPVSIDGVLVPIQAQFPLRQNYSDTDTGVSARRSWGGPMLIRYRLERLRTSLNSRGWMPSGLGRLRRTQSYVLGCGVEKSTQGTGPVIQITTDARTDVPPYARAIDAEGEVLADTAVTLSGRDATVTAVPNATSYVVAWWPLLTVFTRRGIQETGTFGERNYAWSVDFEEFL